jgi:hypothetical protein
MDKDLRTISKDTLSAVVMAFLAMNQSPSNTDFGEVVQSMGVVFFSTNAIIHVVALILSAIMTCVERRTKTPKKRS